MKIDIAKKDLLSLRDVLTRAVRSMEALPNPSSTADMIPVRIRTFCFGSHFVELHD